MDIWSADNYLVKKAYDQENYRIVDVCDHNQTCLIFFSSHNIYYPNNESELVRTIFLRDRYEWMNTACSSYVLENVGRIIFLRDVYKQFYVTGISSKYPSIGETINFLKEKVEGYQVITFGSSAGGYMAMVAGILLKAKYIINNSGNFNINNSLHLESEIIQKAIYNENNRPYLDLRNLLVGNVIPIYYFMAGKNDNECQQYSNVKHIDCIKHIPFSEHNHATTVFPGNWVYLILNEELLNKLYKQSQSKQLEKIGVLFRTVPRKEAIRIFSHEIKEFIKRHIK